MQYPRTTDIESLKKCSPQEVSSIITHLETALAVDFKDLFSLIHYNKKEKIKPYSQKAVIQSLLPDTKDLFELSFQHGDASGLQKGYHNLRQMIDEFSDLYFELYQIVNKCDQLKYLIDTKFM